MSMGIVTLLAEKLKKLKIMSKRRNITNGNKKE